MTPVGVAAGFAIGQATGAFNSLIGPPLANFTTELRYNLNFNDTARQRNQLYKLQEKSIKPDNIGQLVGENTSPLRFSFGQALQWWNQQPVGSENDLRFRLEHHLAASGIPTFRFNGEGLQIESNILAVRDYNATVDEWKQVVRMSAAAAPLGTVVHDYYRSLTEPNELARSVPEAELIFNLQRAGYKRPEDRDRVLRPFAHWDAKEVLRFRGAGLIDDATRDAMLKAAGLSHAEDLRLTNASHSLPDIGVAIGLWFRGLITLERLNQLMALGGVIKPDMQDLLLKMAYKLPPPEMLSQWANVALWNEDFARRYELDDGYEDSPVASFFAAAQGVKDPVALPGQPAGSTDWFKLMYRSKNEMPSFVDCLHMQRRLRPDPDRPGKALRSELPPWTLQNTLDVMKMKGLTPFFTRNMEAALVYEPLNLRFINHLLHPFLEHPEFRARWEPVVGPPEKWVAAAMADHGYRPEICDAAAAGLISQGQDAANLEGRAHEKHLRQESRNEAMREYKDGTITYQEALQRMQDRWYTQDMAIKQLSLIDLEIKAGILERKVKAVKEAFFGGKVNFQVALAQLENLGVRDERRNQYMEEWSWERTEKVKMFSTGDILAAVKGHLMGPDEALARLRNLGWNQADAVLELAHVERDLATAAAKSAAANATKMANEAHKAQVEHDKQRKATAIELAKEVKERAKINRQVALASHEKLKAQSTYYASVHAANSAFEKARDKGDEEKMASLIEKEVADYHKYLIDQLKLVFQGQEVAHVVVPLETVPRPGPRQAAVNSPANPPATDPAQQPADGSGGTAAAPGPATPA